MGKSIIGCDLNEKYCQVSFFSEERQEPQTMENLPYQVPYLYGKAVRREDGDAVRQLMACIGKALEPFGEIGKLVFTVPKIDMDVVRMLKGIGRRSGAQKSDIYVQDYKESFCNYMLYQPKELWQYEAALFTCDHDEVRAFMLRKIRAGRGRGIEPFLTVDLVASARMEELAAVYPVLNVDRAGEADERFEQFIRGVFEKKLVSSVFLVGEGFENSWYPKSLRVLCNGRRAFTGNNLYSKGACYAAYKYGMDPDGGPVYLDETRMMDQICLKLKIRGKEQWYPLVPWGARWYEADAGCELLLEDTDDIEIHVESLADDAVRVEKISLDGLPGRTDRTLRLKVKAVLPDEKTCRISLRDMGFGEFYPASGFHTEKEIWLGGSNGQFNSLS